MIRPNNDAPLSLHARWAWWLGFLVIASQRLGLQFEHGSLPVVHIILILIVLGSIGYSGWRISKKGIGFYLVLLALAVVSFITSPAWIGVPPSISSFILMCITLLPLLTHGNRSGYGNLIFAGALSAIKIGAVLSILQYSLQVLGFGFFDPIASLPSQLILPDFNSHYAVQSFGGFSIWFKPNGIIYLEPSFLSLYSSIGIVILLTIHYNWESKLTKKLFLWICIFGTAMVTSMSLSGLPILAAACVPLAAKYSRKRPALFLGLGAIGFILTKIGAFNFILYRLTEGFTGNTSTAARLYYPYQTLLPIWIQQPFFGWGSGRASIFTSYYAPTISGLQSSTIMKALVEYGAIWSAVLAIAIASSIYYRNRSKTYSILVSTLLCAWLVPAEALLNATLVVLLITGLGTISLPINDSKNFLISENSLANVEVEF